jgi:hypothetical protein
MVHTRCTLVGEPKVCSQSVRLRRMSVGIFVGSAFVFVCLLVGAREGRGQVGGCGERGRVLLRQLLEQH